ncbi:MAG TPA: hypothetical protein PK067_09965 [Kaistella chaponensis]|jgi:hypothetical protein|uniref:hypothetical protein n=1 Tax=Kaistella chaponensis TaxID=713588 RepID=UPI002CA7347D|nr:hypothetical protein [Kaistella chaponensis]HPW89416.1 hypothetical protein [Kaistella chaponensis]HQC07334.1 hypothetical protein [Kaistella chaponensis]
MKNKMITDFEKCNMQSDKTIHHGYQRFYPYFLEPLRTIPNLKMLELGYDNGYSIGIWQSYFNNPSIDSIDIIEDPKDNRLANYYNVNQDKPEELDLFVKNNSGKYQFIIDDASHIPTHQWNTFIRFFSILDASGVYIIEDTETNFWGRAWQYGYAFNSQIFSLYHKIEMINEFINSEFIEENLQTKYNLTDIEFETLNQIEMITLGQNCIIIIKKTEKFKDFYRDFENYKHKNSVHLIDMTEKPLITRIINKVTKSLKSL